MNSSPDTGDKPDSVSHRSDAQGALALEAGVPFEMASSSGADVDPIAEWLSLMEVVQMLCPAWPVRDQPMQGNFWRL